MTANEEKIRSFFKGDVYALETTGIVIEEVSDGYAVCSLTPQNKHVNADGVTQGGALYTLSDFCFALAANAKSISEQGRPNTVTLSVNMNYLRPVKLNGKIKAFAKCVKSGKRICYYDVSVFSEEEPEKILAAATVIGTVL